MKKLAVLTIALVALMFALGGFAQAEAADDIQAIKKAVKENPNYEPGKEVKWFKVLVTDNKAGKDKVRITLPLSLVEAFVKCSGDDHLKHRPRAHRHRFRGAARRAQEGRPHGHHRGLRGGRDRQGLAGIARRDRIRGEAEGLRFPLFLVLLPIPGDRMFRFFLCLKEFPARGARPGVRRPPLDPRPEPAR